MNVRLVASRKKSHTHTHAYNRDTALAGFKQTYTNKTLKFIVIAGRYIAHKAKQNHREKVEETNRKN